MSKACAMEDSQLISIEEIHFIESRSLTRGSEKPDILEKTYENTTEVHWSL